MKWYYIINTKKYKISVYSLCQYNIYIYLYLFIFIFIYIYYVLYVSISSKRPQLKTGSSHISMWRWSPAGTCVRVRNVAAKRCQTHPAETNSARASALSYLSQLARFQPKLGMEGNHVFCWEEPTSHWNVTRCHEFLRSAWVALAGVVEKCQGGQSRNDLHTVVSGDQLPQLSEFGALHPDHISTTTPLVRARKPKRSTRLRHYKLCWAILAERNGWHAMALVPPHKDVVHPNVQHEISDAKAEGQIASDKDHRQMKWIWCCQSTIYQETHVKPEWRRDSHRLGSSTWKMKKWDKPCSNPLLPYLPLTHQSKEHQRSIKKPKPWQPSPPRCHNETKAWLGRNTIYCPTPFDFPIWDAVTLWEGQ